MAMTDPLDQDDRSLVDDVVSEQEWRVAEERRGDPFSAVLHVTTDEGLGFELPLTPELLEAFRDVDDAQQEALGYDDTGLDHHDDDDADDLAALAALDEQDRESGRAETHGGGGGEGLISRARRIDTIDKAFKTVGTDFANGLWDRTPPMVKVVVLAIAAMIILGFIVAVLINAAIQ